ncbi:MAG: beta-N-acetylhexosaminidase [Alteromonadaceae bacterium]|nr:beta-N-acetylhexosaminidase [Alteromonadaceae bacterium]
MKIIKTIPLLVLALLLTSCSESQTNTVPSSSEKLNPSPNVIPALQQWTQGRGFFMLNEGVLINTSEKLKQIGQTFAQDIKEISGTVVSVNTLIDQPTEGTISLALDLNDDEIGPEGYTIDIGVSIKIKANSPAGIFYGTQTLLQILTQDANRHKLPKGIIRDFPTIKNRQYMIDLGRKYFGMDYLKKTIRNMAWYKLNAFHLHFTEWSGFRLKSDKFPELASKQSYSKQELREIQDYAARYHVMIIPEIDLPAHATHIIQYNPDFGFSCDAMLTAKWLPEDMNQAKVGWMLDVTKPEVRKFIHELLEEFIPLFDAPYFYIGGDEWQYDFQKEACPELVAYAKERGFKHTGDVFIEWINEINELVKSHGKTTQIWNWWRFNAKPGWENVTDTQPAQDIIINIWNKPREAQIIADGYQVILTPEEGKGALYSTPGLGGTKPGDYGYFNSKYIYEQWQPVISPQIEGYKVCLWTDGAEQQDENWFDQHIENQKAVFAEKVWGYQGSDKLTDFIKRKESIGYAPNVQ